MARADTRMIDDCNCASLRELAAEVRGELKLLSKAYRDSRSDFEEMKIAIRECVNELKEGSTALKLGETRFDAIDRRLDHHEHDTHKQLRRTLEDLSDMMTEEIDEARVEANNNLMAHKADDARKYRVLAVGGAICVFTLLSTGHASAVLRLIEKYLPK